MNNLKKFIPVLLFVAMFLVMSGCAAGPNPDVCTAASDGNIAGFWLGLWHGLIFLVTFIISLFKHDVSFYEVHNNGSWYNSGFVIGIGILFYNLFDGD